MSQVSVIPEGLSTNRMRTLGFCIGDYWYGLGQIDSICYLGPWSMSSLENDTSVCMVVARNLQASLTCLKSRYLISQELGPMTPQSHLRLSLHSLMIQLDTVGMLQISCRRIPNLGPYHGPAYSGLQTTTWDPLNRVILVQRLATKFHA